MTSMSVGVSGLRVNQTNINTTAHNIANVGTKGYTRQQSISVDFSYNTIGYTKLNTTQVGLGTTMSVIRQTRDVFLDKAYRVEVGRKGFYQAQFEAADEVQTVLGELEGEEFQDTIDNFWEALQEVTKEPDDIVKRTSLMEVGRTFILRASNISKQLEEYQLSLNGNIVKAVDRINQIGEEIRELNSKICAIESGPEQANDYRDARNTLLDELGGLAKITYRENNDGVVTVNLENVQFVTEDKVFELTTEPVDETTDMLKVVWATNGCGDVYDLSNSYSTADNTDIGSLKGLLIARGSKTANYTDIPLKTDKKYYTDDGDFLEVKYNQAVLEYNKTIDSSVIMSAQAQFDQLIHGIVTAMNDVLSPNDTLNTVLGNLGQTLTSTTISYTSTHTINNHTIIDKVEITAAGKTTQRYLDDETNPIGDPVFDDSVTLENVRIWDQYNAPVGQDENKTEREVLFNRKNTERYTETQVTCVDKDGNETTKSIWIYNEEEEDNNYTLYTLGEMEINEKLLKNPSIIPLSGNKYQGLAGGAYDDRICNQLLDAWNKNFATLNPNVHTKSTFKEYYIGFVDDIATKGSEFYGMVEHQEELANSIDSGRQQVEGVSSDEELTNIIKYQHGYNASSRYINAIDEMLEHIINRLGA